MKKKLLVIAAIVVCLSILAAGTIAYFTDEVKVHNVITSSGVDIDIEEWQKGEDGELLPYPETSVDVMPGNELSKIVTVVNNEAEAFIRARYEITIKDAEGNVMELTDEELAEIIIIGDVGGKWAAKDPDDGWMYYTDPVPTGEATEALFARVEFSGAEMDNRFQNCTIEIVVYAQGVQTANNGTTGLEAAGWPAN